MQIRERTRTTPTHFFLLFVCENSDPRSNCPPPFVLGSIQHTLVELSTYSFTHCDNKSHEDLWYVLTTSRTRKEERWNAAVAIERKILYPWIQTDRAVELTSHRVPRLAVTPAALLLLTSIVLLLVPCSCISRCLSFGIGNSRRCQGYDHSFAQDLG
jgi:hypothetical protein